MPVDHSTKDQQLAAILAFDLHHFYQFQQA
jgi:hypothetical protein